MFYYKEGVGLVQCGCREWMHDWVVRLVDLSGGLVPRSDWGTKRLITSMTMTLKVLESFFHKFHSFGLVVAYLIRYLYQSTEYEISAFLLFCDEEPCVTLQPFHHLRWISN